MNPALEYPIADVPEPGAAVPLAPGLLWVRLPVPGALRHVNVWLLAEADGWTLIDTGMNVAAAREAWVTGLAARLQGRPLRRILCTHHHPDHAGLAQWLAARHGAEVWMSAAEAAVMQRLAAVWTDPAAQAARIAAFATMGLELTAARRPYFVLDSYRGAMSGLPTVARTVDDGETLLLGGRRWQVLMLRGHTDGQVLLHDPAAGLLVAGDQVLPRISSNVGVYPERADADPVASFLASFERLAALPPDTLVLPSHGNPFRGLHARLETLRAHHEATLARTLEALDRPRSAADVATQLFRQPLDALNEVLATGETLAHLEWLVRRGRVAVEGSGSTHGARLFRRAN